MPRLCSARACGEVVMKPMLCSEATLDEAKALEAGSDIVIEQKLDGVRALIIDGRLYDRRGKDMTEKFPEFEGLEKLGGPFDGEVLAVTGRFEDTAGRVHQKDKFGIRIAAKMNPSVFHCFDVMTQPGLPLRDRKLFLQGFQFPQEIKVWFAVVEPIVSIEEGWRLVEQHGWEGLVVKDAGGSYEEGKRSTAWRKVKHWSEAVATFTKLEEHPKGVRLETEDGKSVNVNGQQAEYVKFLFKRDGKVEGEVQFLPQKDSEAWRFPSWRGVAGGENGEE